MFVELVSVPSSPGPPSLDSAFYEVKSAKWYALLNKFTKVKKSVLLEGYAHEKDCFVHLKAIMVMFSCDLIFKYSIDNGT